MTFVCPRCGRVATVTVSEGVAEILSNCRHLNVESVDGVLAYIVAVGTRTPKPLAQTISAASETAVLLVK